MNQKQRFRISKAMMGNQNARKKNAPSATSATGAEMSSTGAPVTADGAETHYEKHPDADLYRSKAVRSWTPFAYLMRQKRMSTAEAMTQYWFSRAMGHHALEQDRLYRFATRPHFDGRNETS